MNKQIIKIIKKYWIAPLLILKSFFLTIVQLAWGLVSLGLLGWVRFFIAKEYPLVNFPDFTKLLDLGINIIMDNINIFFCVFFITYSYLEIKELIKQNENI